MRNFADEYSDFMKTHSYKAVNVSGHDFEVIDSGNGGQTIVFLNGMDMPQAWMKYMSAFENNYRVIMMNYPVEVFKNNEMAELLHELFDKLNVTLPVLCGVSDGGVLGQLYAKKYKVGGLIMMSTITVDSSYVAAMKKEQFLLPLMKLYIKKVKYEKLKVMLVNAVKKAFQERNRGGKGLCGVFP